MSEFEREDRYAVIKYKKLTDQQWTLVPSMLENFDGTRVDCVVVEKDWPEYNFVWLMLEHRMAGYSVPDFNAVKCAADVVIAQAELETAKATIAQQAAEIERLECMKENHRIDKEIYLAEVERLKSESFESLYNDAMDEIERLKGGQGEPAASECKTCGGKRIVDDGELTCSSGGIPYENGPIKLVKDCPTCTSQPAPVSVVLPPEDDGNYDYGGYNEGHKHGWNDCLDKVKELNK